MAVEDGRVTFRDVLAVCGFRVMWPAELLSFTGDQFARVALAVLVFSRTGSAALTSLTYALTFIPTVLGALTLSTVADRHSRRGVIVARGQHPHPGRCRHGDSRYRLALVVHPRRGHVFSALECVSALMPPPSPRPPY